MNALLSVLLAAALCACAPAAPADPASAELAVSPPSISNSNSGTERPADTDSIATPTSDGSSEAEPPQPAPGDTVRGKKSAPPCITVTDPNHKTTLCSDAAASASSEFSANDARTFSSGAFHGGHGHGSSHVKLVPVVVPIVKKKLIKVPVHDHGSHGHYEHAYGGHRSAWSQQGGLAPEQRFAYTYYGPTDAFGQSRTSAAAFDAEMVAQQDAQQAQLMEARARAEAEQAQLMEARALEVDQQARSAAAGFSYAPLPNNFLAPTGYAHGAPDLVGFFPRGPAGGCGGIPLLFSCSPNLVRGSLVQAAAHGSGAQNVGYASSYQLAPWGYGGRAAYRQNEELQTGQVAASDTNNITPDMMRMQGGTWSI